MQRGLPSLPPQPARVAPNQAQDALLHEAAHFGQWRPKLKFRRIEVAPSAWRLPSFHAEVGHSSQTLFDASAGSGLPSRRASNALAPSRAWLDIRADRHPLSPLRGGLDSVGQSGNLFFG